VPPQDHPIDLPTEHRRQTEYPPTTYCAAQKIKGDVQTGSDLDLMNTHAFIARHYCPIMKSEVNLHLYGVTKVKVH